MNPGKPRAAQTGAQRVIKQTGSGSSIPEALGQGCNLGCSSFSYGPVHPGTRIPPELRHELP